MEELLQDDDSFYYDVADTFNNESVCSNKLLEDSFSSTIFPSDEQVPVAQSTPHSSKKTKQRRSCDKPDKPRLSCSQCSKTYANERTLSLHIKMHAMKSVSTRIPKEADMILFTEEALSNSLAEVISEGSKSETTILLSEYCAFVKDRVQGDECQSMVLELSNRFLTILKTQNVLLPSALRNCVNRRCNALLNSSEFVTTLKDNLKQNIMKETQESVLNSFVGNVCFKVFTWQLILCLRRLRGQSADNIPSRCYSSDAMHPKEFGQLVYHISGSVLHGILKKSRLYSSNPDWVTYREIVHKCFLVDTSSSESQECSHEVLSFTEGRNRGGLLFCSQESHDFFMLLFETIMSAEKPDGSLPPTEVDNKVFGNDILIFMWDDLVGSELTEEQNLQLLSQIIKCCSKVTAKGVLKRRENIHNVSGVRHIFTNIGVPSFMSQNSCTRFSCKQRELLGLSRT